MKAIKLPYLHVYKDRHGVLRHYYRRNGKSIPLKAKTLLADYTVAHASFDPTTTGKAIPGSFGELVQMYLTNSAFRDLRDSTKARYRRQIEPANVKLAAVPLKGVTKRVLLKYRESLSAHRVTANDTIGVLRILLAFAVENEMLATNPALTIKPLRVESDGWAPWSDAALEKFAQHSRGIARTAFFLALYTGQRRGDIVSLRWSDVGADGKIHLTQQKTGKELVIPLDPVLKAELDRTPKNGLTILQQRNGKPVTYEGFGTAMNRECRRLKIVGMPFHGLRKNATINLLEMGCTHAEAKSITGHSTDAMINHYANKINQEKLADSAMRKMLANPSG